MLKFIIIGVCACIGIGVAVFPIKEGDDATYEKLINSSNPETAANVVSYSQQKREGVCKQIWYQEKTPLYFRIDSEASELSFFKQNNKTEVVEHLANVTCIMQEEVYMECGIPMQKIRYLEAEKASYNYTTHLFIAEDAQLFKYHLPGHEPPRCVALLTPLMEATARLVEFTLKGEKLDFVAHQMKAKLNSKDKL